MRIVITTVIHEPASVVTIAGILMLGVVLDYGWKRTHGGERCPARALGQEPR